jgi:hypothetical protein
MGGLGSGRPENYTRATVERQRAIDLADLRRWGMLDRPSVIEWSRGGASSGTTIVVPVDAGVRLLFRDPEGQLKRQYIEFTTTPTRFGGRRQWFKCPSCGRGCRVIYGRRHLRCRRCMGLRYQSQFESKRWRLDGQAIKLRMRLGGSASLRDPFPPKPKHMRWASYKRLTDSYVDLLCRIEAHWTAQVASLESALARRRPRRKRVV